MEIWRKMMTWLSSVTTTLLKITSGTIVRMMMKILAGTGAGSGVVIFFGSVSRYFDSGRRCEAAGRDRG
jgi:hypothetical protein